ncbi:MULTISPECIES: glycosyltransferase family 39 protein [unclassified Streptococcus]|uniref:glycosyltransferase family 39 protein n=2 Tax=unclassified Streptococcus TaxID=2608887 RepID=UPI001D15EDA6|nr:MULTISPECIES: glycosyltransferase family 39 protein [unclassified Streptococcus]MCQ9214143.1 glycosyltransferase family 39 protein [Streptococcus sp. O1]
MYHLFFNCLQKLMWLITLFWLVVVVQELWSFPSLFLYGLALLVLLVMWKKNAVHRLYCYAMAHKRYLLGLALVFQVLVILSANLLVRRDAAVVITGALRLLDGQSISNYLTRNPNNLPMFLYARALYHLFGFEALWVLQVLGVFYINGTAYILYRTGRDFFSQRVADSLFTLYLLLLGFSPYVIQTYTDITSLPFLAGQLYLMVALLKEERNATQRLCALGLLTAIASIFRPTALVIVIAFTMLLFLKEGWQRFVHYMAILVCSFGFIFAGLTYVIRHQQEVKIIHDETLAKGLTTFINLGLTYSGTDQEDMKAGLLNYIDSEKRSDYNNGMFAKENEIKEIKRRLRNYTAVTFVQHLKYKLAMTLYDGSLNWIYRKPENEKTPLVSPLYKYTKENRVAEAIRQSIIEYEGDYYQYYQVVKQFIWLVAVLGLVIAVWRYRPDDTINFLSLAIFGGLLFLMIFEGGKTRYLLQFFPQILLLSSLGLTRLCDKEGTKEVEL